MDEGKPGEKCTLVAVGLAGSIYFFRVPLSDYGINPYFPFLPSNSFILTRGFMLNSPHIYISFS